MIAYHGTNSDFDKFDASYFGQNTDDNASDESMALTAHLGFWLTSNRNFAANVYDKVLECELSIENPMLVESLEQLAYWAEAQEKTADELREMIIEWGYDGIVIENDEEFEGTSYVAFSPEQISILK